MLKLILFTAFLIFAAANGEKFLVLGRVLSS
jgi:hypothetical protein